MLLMRKVLWIVPGVIWLLFTFWYTDFGGQLTDQEIDEGMQVLRERNFDPEGLEQLEGFLRNDTGRHFLMVNNLDVNDSPPVMPALGNGSASSPRVLGAINIERPR